MKSFLKIGSLFTLIVVGRYMQLTTPAATAGLAKSPISISASDTTATMTLARYTNGQPVVATPVSQRQGNQPMTWF